MRVTRFDGLVVWQKAQDLAVVIYMTFRESKDFGFKDQICRAAVSISNNMSEGFDRGSGAELIRFLSSSRAAGNEVKSMSYLALRIGYITQYQQDSLIIRSEELSRMINGLIRSLSKQAA
ncbi:four helix bundle protein [Fibrella arboris]|uniref:four helix bundle protein n=1 Tax=Fibrella arboris TaxID=3242486 RepID=UPI00352228F4